MKYSRLCTGSEDGFVRLWDISAGRATWRVFHPTRRKAEDNDVVDRHGVQAIAVDRGGVLTQLVSGGSDGTVRLWDVREPKPVEHLVAHSCAVSSVAVHGERMLSASLDGSAILWDVRSPASAVETVDLLGPRPRGMQGRSGRGPPSAREDPILFRGSGGRTEEPPASAEPEAPSAARRPDSPPASAATPRSAAHGWSLRSWNRQ